jgi:hypothetical protein
MCRSTCVDKVDAFLGLVTFWPVSKCHMSFPNEEAQVAMVRQRDRDAINHLRSHLLSVPTPFTILQSNAASLFRNHSLRE